MNRSTLSLAAFALVLAVPACRNAELRDPAPIAANADQAKNISAIKKALQERGWVLEKEGPGQIDAMVVVRGKHTAKVTIKHDQSTIQILYRDSANLEYEVDSKGRRTIHDNYMSWVNNLRNDIARHLSLSN